MSDSSWRYPEQRRADPPPVRRERRGATVPAEDTFGDLYRAPAGSATGHGRAQRLPDRSAGDAVAGGYRQRYAGAGGGLAGRFADFGDDGEVPARTHGWGRLPGRYGVLIVTAGAAAGAVATLIAGTEPGTVLGVALVAGALAGAFVVHPRAAYRLVPVPAIAGFAAALLAGVVHDRAMDTSRTVLALNALGWMAGAFATMAVATVVTLVVAVARHIWYNRSQRVSDGSVTGVPWDYPS